MPEFTVAKNHEQDKVSECLNSFSFGVHIQRNYVLPYFSIEMIYSRICHAILTPILFWYLCSISWMVTVVAVQKASADSQSPDLLLLLWPRYFAAVGQLWDGTWVHKIVSEPAASASLRVLLRTAMSALAEWVTGFCFAIFRWHLLLLEKTCWNRLPA